MVDPIITAKGLLTAGGLALKVKSKLETLTNTARLQEAVAVEARAWRATRDAQVERRLAGLEDRPDAAESVAAMLADPQFTRLHRNLEFEAAREATDERRLMLAYLAAGLTDPALPINEKARIERAVRGLDGEHILTLRRIAINPSTEAKIEQTHPDVFHALVTSACVAVSTHSFANRTPHATPLGLRVVEALETYVPLTQEPPNA